MRPAIIVHGGAWNIPDELVEPHVAGTSRAAEEGWKVLSSGGNALDAVETAVRVMEDDPTFDAGVGSFLNEKGFVELDAAIMDGEDLRAGAVGAVRRVRHPITLARAVMEKTEHVMLVGDGAERFAESVGVEMCDPRDLVVERELERWRRGRGSDIFSGDTVGAVALDSSGRVAAAVSTGGTPFKMVGRVGDSPIIGAGLYADGKVGAAVSTGWGEGIMRVLMAKSVVDAMASGTDPGEAAERGLRILEERTGGKGGLIVIDLEGRIGLAHTTPRMAYAYVREGGKVEAGVEIGK